jgi:predicted ester cyclase
MTRSVLALFSGAHWGRQETWGRDGWRRYRDLVRAGSADFCNEIVELVCDGQRAAARLRCTGTHTGVLLGMPATQRHFEYAGAAFFTADSRWLTSLGSAVNLAPGPRS